MKCFLSVMTWDIGAEKLFAESIYHTPNTYNTRCGKCSNIIHTSGPFNGMRAHQKPPSCNSLLLLHQLTAPVYVIPVRTHLV